VSVPPRGRIQTTAKAFYRPDVTGSHIKKIVINRHYFSFVKIDRELTLMIDRYLYGGWTQIVGDPDDDNIVSRT
jgi:hypothetical protein